MTPELKNWFQGIGKSGGNARAEKLTPARRKRIARKAANARWEKHKIKKSEAA
jgi:hypothetical protein